MRLTWKANKIRNGIVNSFKRPMCRRWTISKEFKVKMQIHLILHKQGFLYINIIISHIFQKATSFVHLKKFNSNSAPLYRFSFSFLFPHCYIILSPLFIILLKFVFSLPFHLVFHMFLNALITSFLIAVFSDRYHIFISFCNHSDVYFDAFCI